jgi:hypothetical protein
MNEDLKIFGIQRCALTEILSWHLPVTEENHENTVRIDGIWAGIRTMRLLNLSPDCYLNTNLYGWAVIMERRKNKIRVRKTTVN